MKLLEENNRRLRYLSKEECQTLLSACSGHIPSIALFALNTGCRKGEILGIKWDNVDLATGLSYWIEQRTATRERHLLTLLSEALNKTLQDVLIFPRSFMINAAGKPYQDAKRSFSTALRKARIRDSYFHDLRHTFTSHLVMAGIDIIAVKELLGHKKP